MAHIHEKIDFTTSAYIVHPDLNKVLLVLHKKLNQWLQIGGHVELDEDTDQALAHEIAEECGLDVEILSAKPGKGDARQKVLYRPDFVNLHNFDPAGNHKHLDLAYVAIAKTTEFKPAPGESTDLRWFTRHDLYDTRFGIPDTTRWYCLEAIKMAKAHHAKA